MTLTPIADLPRGHTLYREPNDAGGHRYWSDAVDGGVIVWDTCLVSEEELTLAMRLERERLDGGAPNASPGERLRHYCVQRDPRRTARVLSDIGTACAWRLSEDRVLDVPSLEASVLALCDDASRDDLVAAAVALVERIALMDWRDEVAAGTGVGKSV